MSMNEILTFLTTNRIAVVFLRWCFWFAVILIAVFVLSLIGNFVASYTDSLSSQIRGGIALAILAGIALLMSFGGSKE